MENNNITLTNITSVMPNKAIEEESELAIQFLDILNFTGLMESETAQTVMSFLRRLTGFQQELEYAMVAI
jgi:hypothetical protein